MNKLEEARRSGIAYALKVILDAQENGKSAQEAIDALVDELRYRNITSAPLSIPRSQVEAFSNEVKANCIVGIECVALMTLHDEFGFGHDRIMRFSDRFMKKTECLADDYASWKDYTDILLDECKVKLELPADFFVRDSDGKK